MKEFLINAGPLVGAIKTLKPFVSDESTRPYLCGVFFELEDDSDTLNMVATDGAKLCVLNEKVDRADLFYTGALSAIVPEKALDTILVMLKGVQGDCPISVRFDDSGARTKLHIDTPDEKGEFKCIDGHYPEYRKVIPTKKAKFIIGLAKAQATECMKAVAAAGGDGLQWEMVDEHSALRMRGENKLVIVMPMRVTLPGEPSAAPSEPEAEQQDMED